MQRFIRPLVTGILVSSPCLVYYNSPKNWKVYAFTNSDNDNKLLNDDLTLPTAQLRGIPAKPEVTSFKDAFTGIRRILPKSLQPKPIRIAQRQADGKLLIQVDELKKVFKKAEDNPIAVYAISGISRSGKSFLLTRCLDRLMSLPKSKQSGSECESQSETESLALLTEPEDELYSTKNPFVWNNQADPLTSGIWIWSEPINLILPSGQTVSIILLDCQGCFDDQTTLNEDANIFAFSTLLSSVHIFNIKNNVDESLLQFLELFVGIARMIKLSTNNRSSRDYKNNFQTLMLLVRDFQLKGYDLGYHDDNSCGDHQNYKYNKLDPKSIQPEDHQRTRTNILKSFHKVCTFLMPHPGKSFIKTDDTNELDDEFQQTEIQLLGSLFSPEKIVIKTIDGVEQTGRSIQDHIENWASIFETANIPNLPTTTDAISKYQFIGAVEFAKHKYEKAMDSFLRGSPYQIEERELRELHDKYSEEAVSTFQNHLILFGTYDDADFKKEFENSIEKLYSQFQDKNLLKPISRWYNWVYDNGVQKVINVVVITYKYTETGIKYVWSFYGK